MRLRPFLVVGMLGAHAALLAWGAIVHSPTADEPAHMLAGISHWRFQRFRLYAVNPPLVRTLATAPIVCLGSDSTPPINWAGWDGVPWRRPEFELARGFNATHGLEVFRLITIARWACIPLTLLGGVICYRWAYELYGNNAGLIALGLWCFSPNIMAHSQLITPDAGAAALGVAACYGFWRWMRNPRWSRAVMAGALLGLAQLTKFTWIVLFVVWPCLWVIWRFRRPHRRHYDGRRLVTILILGLYVVNLGYAFEGSFKPLSHFDFVSKSFGGAHRDSELVGNRFRGTWLGTVPVPLPHNYLNGIDLQKYDFERRLPSYLGGQWKQGGWWYYYLYGLSVKVPLGTWALIVLAVIVSTSTSRGQLMPFQRQDVDREHMRAGGADAGATEANHGSEGGQSITWRDDIVVLTPAAVVLVLVSAETGFSHHLRYVLLILPFVFIWTSRIALALSYSQHPLLTVVATSAAAWSIGSSLWMYPHSLSYFNELVGGPAHGHEHLIDSNIDWGQDLLFLRKWLDGHPEAGSIRVAYWGSVDPEVVGIRSGQPPKLSDKGPRRGWYAVSVNCLRGFDFAARNAGARSDSVAEPSYSYFLEFRPVARAGYSIYIYNVSLEDANRVRRELGLQELPPDREQL